MKNMGRKMKARAMAGQARAEQALGPGAQGYMDAVTPGATKIQDALVDLIGGGSHPIEDPSLIRQQLGEMAASPRVLNLLQAMPAVGSIYGATVIPDMVDQIVSDEESFANTPMDLLGMGGGAAAAYGINRGTNRLGGTTPAGKALAYASMMGVGKLGSDVLGGLF